MKAPAKLTINQGLDLLYNYHNIDAFPEVKELRTKLSKFKFLHGRNTFITNPEIIHKIVKAIEDNPKNKK